MHALKRSRTHERNICQNFVRTPGHSDTSTFTNSTITMGAGTLYANVKVTLNNSSITLTSVKLKSDVGQFLLR